MSGMGGGALGGAAGANDLMPSPHAAAPQGATMGLPVPGGF